MALDTCPFRDPDYGLCAIAHLGNNGETCAETPATCPLLREMGEACLLAYIN